MSATSSSPPSSPGEKDSASDPVARTSGKTSGTSVETHQVKLRDIDDAAALVAGFHGEVTEDQSRRVRRKVDLHILPLM